MYVILLLQTIRGNPCDFFCIFRDTEQIDRKNINHIFWMFSEHFHLHVVTSEFDLWHGLHHFLDDMSHMPFSHLLYLYKTG